MQEEIDWSRYKLEDLPIPGSLPLIDITAGDDRINGKIFYEPVAAESLDSLTSFIAQGNSPIFLNSKDAVLGTGKSAVMAAEYWKHVGKDTCFWVNVVGASPMKTILLKVAYEMSLSGAIEHMKKRLVAKGGIQEGLQKIPELQLTRQPLAHWIVQTLSAGTEAFPLALADVKRKTRAFSVTEAFVFVLDVYKKVVGKRVIIFLDQLEMYVRYNSARQISLELNELHRGISDKAILVATMHTDALVKLQTQCGPDVQTFLENAPVIQLPRYSAQDLVRIGTFLLSRFRKGQADKFYPFTEDSLSFIAQKSGNNIRRFLVRMRSALMFGARSGYEPLNRKFLSSGNAMAQVFIETSTSE
jgi:hypothetical protein